jgi:hypothetical protein
MKSQRLIIKNPNFTRQWIEDILVAHDNGYHGAEGQVARDISEYWSDTGCPACSDRL